jgi:hypothetical protein
VALMRLEAMRQDSEAGFVVVNDSGDATAEQAVSSEVVDPALIVEQLPFEEKSEARVREASLLFFVLR